MAKKKREETSPEGDALADEVIQLQGEGAAAEWVPIDAVHPWPGNPRKNAHVIPEIARSLENFGWGRPLIARRANGELVIGHTAYEAAKLLKLANVPVRFVDLSEERAHALAIADNKLGELAEWDERLLLASVRELEQKLPDFDPADLGMAQEDMDRLDRLAKSTEPAQGDDPGAGELPKVPVSQPGEIYELGPHRLMCGDSTSEEDVQRLMNGERAQLLATDPPYLVDYDGNNHPNSHHKKAGRASENVGNKKWDEYKDPDSASNFFEAWLRVALAHAVEENVAIYQWYASVRHVLVEQAWKANGVLAHAQIIWVKERAVLTHSHFMWQHEPCLYGWVQGKLPKRRPPPDAKTVWPISQKDSQSGIHPTEKPTEIFERPIGWHTLEGDLVFEPFCGSGSQLIAAAKLGRRCYAMEKAPEFCDAIRKRWTGFAKSAGIDPGSGALE